MNPDVITALLNAGLLDAETADIIRRQSDEVAARAWAETIVNEATQAGLSAQQQRLIDLVAASDGNPTQAQLAAFWAGEDALLLQAMQPALLQVATERGALAAVGGGQADAFALINQQVINWVEDYYISAEAGAYGSIPNLNLTTRTQLGNAFIQWQQGELEIGSPTGLQQLIDALTATFGPVRAEAISVTEVTRCFIEAQRQAEANNPYTVGFRWLTSVDEAVCPICSPHNGEVRRKTAGYSGGADIPAHPRCRCQEAIETEATLRIPFNG